MQRSLTKTAPATPRTKLSAASSLLKPLSETNNNNNNNFELEDDAWPNVDVGNLLNDLDADIMSSTTTTTTKTAKSSNESEVNDSVTAKASSPAPTATPQLGDTAAMTLAPVAEVNSAAADNDKDLKIKIKRTKSGTTRNPEGKLEIVQKKGADNGMEGSGTSTDLTLAANMPLSADAVVSAVTAAVAKQNGRGSEVKIVSSAVNKKNAKAAKNNGTNGGKANSRKTAAGGSNSGASSSDGPAAKKQKVDASVGTEMATMTEPESLGPMDPGSSVTLEGIVWHETDNGVLVINVTWRGKTYVGTLLDSTRHVDHWAPPRYSDSPTSELESRAPKGNRASKRNRGGGTASESESRKVLRSSKGKGNRLGANSNAASPAKDKRKGRSGTSNTDSDADSSDRSKRPRTSSRNSPDENGDGDDSDKDNGDDKKDGEKNDDDTMTPKDKEDEKYVPPPPLPYALKCPKPGCSKRFRHHNGLRFHVSSAHRELLNENGEIRDMSEIERLEEEAKSRLSKKAKKENGEAESSAASSNSSTPGPSDPSNTANVKSEDKKPSLPLNQQPNLTSKLAGPPPNAKPIPVSAIEGVLARPPLPILNGPPVPVTVTAGCLPSVTGGNVQLAPKIVSAQGTKPIIRPPINARPIVPAAGPLAGGGQGAINLKPIQPRPTIMADPTPHLALDELRKRKEPKKKKDNGSPGTSPPRGINGGSGHSPKSNGGNNGVHNLSQDGGNGVQQPVKSPAYSDISDDGTDKKKGDSKPAGLAPPPLSYVTSFPYPFMPGVTGAMSPQLPQVPISTLANNARATTTTTASSAAAAIGLPSPASSEYQKLLQAYGFPPMPHPIPAGMDAATHLQLLASDPGYRARFEQDRAKEKMIKDQQEREKEQLEKQHQQQHQRRVAAAAAAAAAAKTVERSVRTPEDLRKKESSSGLSVKSEFRIDASKAEPKSGASTPKPNGEGSKPTMETRGPPPGMNAYGYMQQGMRPGFPPGYPFGMAGVNPLLFAAGYGGMNPFLAGHPAVRPPFGPPGSNPADLLGLRAPFPPTSSSAAAVTSRADDLTRAAAAMAAAVPAGASPGSSNAKMMGMLRASASLYGNHKIHELQDRALKSPSSGKASPKTQSPGPRKDKTPSPAPPPPSSLSAAASSSGSRSPPPLRHVHTHTHTHFGMPFGMMPPPPGAAPAAHTPIGFPNPLLSSPKPPGFPPK